MRTARSFGFAQEDNGLYQEGNDCASDETSLDDNVAENINA
jgi:hypothetical protein